jgi:hypothetical protein
MEITTHCVAQQIIEEFEKAERGLPHLNIAHSGGTTNNIRI